MRGRSTTDSVQLTLAKCIPLKMRYLSYRKGTKKFGSRSGGILVKKGCKMGGVSL